MFAKKKKKPQISTPTNFEHRVHTGFDKSKGKFVGLPLQWASIVGNNQILKSTNRPLPLVDPSEITPTEILDLKTIVRGHNDPRIVRLVQGDKTTENGGLPKTSTVARSNSLRSSSPPRLRRDYRLHLQLYASESMQTNIYKWIAIFFVLILRNNANLPPSVPEGQEVSSSASQIQPYPSFGKPHGYPDKSRQNLPNVAPVTNPNLQSLIPNLQNLNPNMQSSPNLTHVGSNTPNLSLNFQNLSPIIPNVQNPSSNASMPQTDHDFQRINGSSSVSGQYNGNSMPVSDYFKRFLYCGNWTRASSDW